MKKELFQLLFHNRYFNNFYSHTDHPVDNYNIQYNDKNFKEDFTMFGFEEYARKKVVIDKTQNEETAKNYGVNMIAGDTVWMMVLGSVVHTKDAYYLIDTNGNRLSGGFPVGYAHDDGAKYLIYLMAPGFIGAFKEG